MANPKDFIRSGLAVSEVEALQARVEELERALGLLDDKQAAIPEWVRVHIRQALNPTGAAG